MCRPRIFIVETLSWRLRPPERLPAVGRKGDRPVESRPLRDDALGEELRLAPGGVCPIYGPESAGNFCGLRSAPACDSQAAISPKPPSSARLKADCPSVLRILRSAPFEARSFTVSRRPSRADQEEKRVAVEIGNIQSRRFTGRKAVGQPVDDIPFPAPGRRMQGRVFACRPGDRPERPFSSRNAARSRCPWEAAR